jgi:hypothetical protein
MNYTFVVIKGLSLRSSSPGRISLVATRPKPLDSNGRNSSVDEERNDKQLRKSTSRTRQVIV